MITQNLKKLKKYLFFISIVFFVVTLSHLSYSYLYSDSKNSPVKGGTISEGIIGNFPTLNPLLPLSSDGNDKYIIQLLYRSILRYDIDQQKIVGDIANCDISSLINISCIINENAKWSNGESITANDILATYQFIRDTNSNKVLISLLEGTDIESKNNEIIFKNTRKDVNFLNVFFQPILNQDFINTLSYDNINGNFPTEGGIYSGKFKIDRIYNDENLGITKLILAKNEFYDESNIAKIILNIFPDINSFKKNYQAVNIFNDSENNIGNSLAKFESQKYTLNSFVGLFLNQNKITNTELRTYILNKIDNSSLLKLLNSENFEDVKNPFLTENTISRESKIKNFDLIMAELGYRKKSSFVQEIIPAKEKTVTSGENSAELENKKEISIPSDLTLDRYQKKSATIYSPSYVDLYNFITKDDVLLKGNADANTTAVYINDYKLANYKAGDKEFYYRLKESIGSLKPGRNTYKIYFEIGGEKIFKEEILFVYYSDREKLKNEEKEIAIELYKKEVEETKKQEPKKEETTTTEEKDNVNVELVEKINSLDENLYYDKNHNPFTLKLFFLNDGKKETQDTVLFIENSLKELGITIESKAFLIKDLASIISNKDEYDMILSGIHLGYLNFNIFPYLHSSQAKSGYNFANFRSASMDLLVEELRENIYTEEKTKQLEEKVLDILKEEQVLKTLYTPKINLLVDKSIKSEKIYSSLPYKSERKGIMENFYVKEEKTIDLTDKNFSGFFSYLLKKLYE